MEFSRYQVANEAEKREKRKCLGKERVERRKKTHKKEILYEQYTVRSEERGERQ